MAAVLIEAMEAAAIAAAATIERCRAAGVVARMKADRSPVTVADESAEALILAALADAAPDVPIVAEERCALGHRPDTAERFFLVDPLDGTREYVDGTPHYTVNIALIEDGRAVLGVVVAPGLNRLWAGDAAAGRAWARDLPEGRAQAIRARAAGGAPVGLASRCVDCAETRTWFARAGVGEVRTVGSSLKLCLIAEGAADLYPRHTPTSEWDIAAGQAVLEAAGGCVLTADGTPLRYGKPGGLNCAFVAAGAFEPPLP